jgi:NADPH:quinone reductase-like Zn-dependent oxidoreductase
MRAVPFFSHGSADVLEYRKDFPDPVAARNQSIVKVEYCGVNHLDIWTRQGTQGKKIKLPHVCGCDIVGRENSGERVIVYPGISCGRCARCRDGSENLCGEFAIIGGLSDHDGGYAEKVAVPSKNLIPLPKSLKPELAATLAISYLVAWNMLTANGAGKKKTVLVYGAASGVGMATIQLAKAMGATVLTTVSGSAKREFAERLGADLVIDRNSESVAEAAARFSRGGVDLVVDHVGAATWQTSISALKPGGRMAVCGMTSGNEAVVPVRMFYSKQIVMTGALVGTRRQLQELVNFVVRKKIRPVIDSVVPLADAGEAHKRMEAGRHMGKILIDCR